MSDPYADYEEDSEVTLDPSNKAPSSKVELFKGEKGKTYRAALLYFHSLEKSIILSAKKKAKKEGIELKKGDVEKMIQQALSKKAEEIGKSVDELEPWEKLDTRSVQFKKYQSQFKEGVGVVLSRLGKDGAEADKYWNMLEEPRTYYATVILIYPTDRKGNVDKGALLRDSLVMPWRCAPATFNRLVDVNTSLKELGNGLSLANQDIKLTCKNSQFQNFDIDFAGEAIWTKSEKIRKEFFPQAAALYEKMIDARAMSTADLKEKLGSGDDSGDDVTDDEDMEDLLGNI